MLPSDGVTHPRAVWIAWSSLLFLCAISIVACSDDIPEWSTDSETMETSRLPTQTYVPLAHVQSALRGPLHYSSWLGRENHIDSAVSYLIAEPAASYGALVFQVACTQGEVEFYMIGPQETVADSFAVEVKVDGGSAEQQRWQGVGSLGLELVGKDAQSFYSELRFAEHLSITVPELRIGPADVPVRQLLNTSIQDNLDYCGDYHPTERRVAEPTHMPLTGVGGAVSPYLTYEAVESVFGSRIILTSSVRVAALQADESVPGLRLVLLCSGVGRFVVRFEGLSLEHVSSRPLEFIVTMDDSVATRSEWWISSDGDEVVADVEEVGLLAGMLLADSMTLQIPDLEIGPVVFDLTGLLETPIQGNLDHCGAYAENKSSS
ncbi:MAG: hypothetical protein OXD50_12420 [Chloroflexi bacterium]|nr:hypothetical protein [Chloroflexota bacterium]